MAELRTVNTQSKNSMPTFVETNYNNLVRGLNDKLVNPPIFGYLSDLECMVFVDSKGNIHKILIDKIIGIEEQLEGLKDPDTGETISVVEYVKPTMEYVEDIKKNGAAIMLVSGGDE